MHLSNAVNNSSFDTTGTKTKLCIGLVADTHIPRDVKTMPPHIKEAFKGVDLIIHAGDIYRPEVLDELEIMDPVMAVEGNGDSGFPSDNRFKEKHILKVAGLNLGLTHAINYPMTPTYPLEEILETYFGGRMDIVVFGHTHVPTVERYNGILLVNPGSPTLPWGRYELGTVGLLEITAGRAEARIIQLNEFSLPFDWNLIYL